ncbi:MAG: RNA-binding domain-containing protein [Actinomycetota bacterium]
MSETPAPDRPAPIERSGDVERVGSLRLDDPGGRLELVRHVVAMANSGGGTVVIGEKRNGNAVGVGADVAAAVSATAVGELVADAVRPDRVEMVVTRADVGDGRQLVEIKVSPSAEPPLVMARAGTVPADGSNGGGNGDGGANGDGGDHGGAPTTVFAAHEVVVRRSGRTETARRDDHLRWRTEALDALRRELSERLALVVEAPAGATVRVVTGDEVLDEPSYLLSRSTDLFRLQPEQLLSSSDLVYLWLHRRTLTFTDDAVRLLVHSALRKRATLYLWLSVLPVTAEQVRRLLFEAVAMRDRDKSDAARAVLLICALYLGDDDYEALVDRLRESSYAHMRSAAETLPDRAHAEEQLRNEALVGSGQEQLLLAPANELYDHVDRLLSQGGNVPRRVPSFGLELLNRRLRSGIPDA